MDPHLLQSILERSDQWERENVGVQNSSTDIKESHHSLPFHPGLPSWATPPRSGISQPTAATVESTSSGWSHSHSRADPLNLPVERSSSLLNGDQPQPSMVVGVPGPPFTSTSTSASTTASSPSASSPPLETSSIDEKGLWNRLDRIERKVSDKSREETSILADAMASEQLSRLVKLNEARVMQHGESPETAIIRHQLEGLRKQIELRHICGHPMASVREDVSSHFVQRNLQLKQQLLKAKEDAYFHRSEFIDGEKEKITNFGKALEFGITFLTADGQRNNPNDTSSWSFKGLADEIRALMQDPIIEAEFSRKYSEHIRKQPIPGGYGGPSVVLQKVCGKLLDFFKTRTEPSSKLGMSRVEAGASVWNHHRDKPTVNPYADEIRTVHAWQTIASSVNKELSASMRPSQPTPQLHPQSQPHPQPAPQSQPPSVTSMNHSTMAPASSQSSSQPSLSSSTEPQSQLQPQPQPQPQPQLLNVEDGGILDFSSDPHADSAIRDYATKPSMPVLNQAADAFKTMTKESNENTARRNQERANAARRREESNRTAVPPSSA